MSTAREVASKLVRRLNIPYDEAITLARAEKTLTRWGELECGDGNDRASWGIERDEKTKRPFLVTHPRIGKSYRRPVPDKETGALKRIAATCERNGLHYFHQTDPRGCSLYVAREPLTDTNYSGDGIAVC